MESSRLICRTTTSNRQHDLQRWNFVSLSDWQGATNEAEGFDEINEIDEVDGDQQGELNNEESSKYLS